MLLIKKRFLHALLFLAATAALSGCGRSTETVDGIPLADLSGPASDALWGRWNSGCLAFSPSSQSEHYKLIATFSNGVFSHVFAVYADATCSNLISHMEMTGTYSLGASLASPEGATEINTINRKLQYTFMTQSAVDRSNRNHECGFSDWTANQTRDVSSTVCGGPDEGMIGTERLSIYKIEGNRLYFGLMHRNGSEPIARDSEFDTERPLTRM